MAPFRPYIRRPLPRDTNILVCYRLIDWTAQDAVHHTNVNFVK